MLQKVSSKNAHQFILLAIEFKILDSFLSEYIKRAGTIDEISGLLEHVDYMSKPETIKMVLDKYDQDSVSIGEVRENLKAAFQKLDSYNKLMKAAVRVSSKQSHCLFMQNHQQKGNGRYQDTSFHCLICN